MGAVGTIGQKPLYACTGCYGSHTFPADDLVVYNGKCWCGVCWAEYTFGLEEDHPAKSIEYCDLPSFTPIEDGLLEALKLWEAHVHICSGVDEDSDEGFTAMLESRTQAINKTFKVLESIKQTSKNDEL